MTEYLDARRLLCPLPVIRVQNKVKHMRPGERLQVVCTDPGALQDIPAWCRINGHTIVETLSADDEIVIILEVGAA
ncbi:MAG: sulfurtransferase TusA family protein [Gammaproteobacteria bacterium]